MQCRIHIIVLTAVLLLGGAPSPAGAHDDQAPPESWSPWGAGVPELGETRFVSTSFLPSPFVRTVLRNKLGYGKADDIRLTLIKLDDDPVMGLEGDVLHAVLDIEYKHAVREWLAVWGGARLSARLGNEIQSLLAPGVSLFTALELGWLVRIYESDRHIVSTSISLNNSNSTIVDIYGWVDRIIEDGGLEPDNELVMDVPRLYGVLDLRYAAAVSDMVGIQASVAGLYGEALDRQDGNEWSYILGALLHFDLHARSGVPVGFAVGCKRTSIADPVESSQGDSNAFLLNASYTGRRDFTFGLDITYYKVPMARLDEDANVFSALASMWYYF